MTPLLLAIDTATPIGTVALFEGAALLGCLEYRLDKAHARLLMPMIDTLLRGAQVDKHALAAIAVSQGPGSYTGLRIGVSTAKGLCMALEKPLLAVGSLEALAWKVQPLAARLGAWVCPMLDARRMEVYCQLFDAAMQPQSSVHALVIDEGSFAAEMDARKVIFIGDGAAKCKSLLEITPNAIVLDQFLSTAADMGPAALAKFAAAQFEDLPTFEPFYLKDFVATAKVAKKAG